MANQVYLDILKQGVEVWNQWREEHPDILQPDLSKAWLRGRKLEGAQLSYVDLKYADLRWADLSQACLTDVQLEGANLRQAKLCNADLRSADLNGADLREADLSGAFLVEARLAWTDLRGAKLCSAVLDSANLFQANLEYANLEYTDLTCAILRSARLEKTKLTGANLTDCSVYGISIWNAQLDGAIQSNLLITDYLEPKITVDDIEVAQFIYLLLNNKKIRNLIDTITSKVVLILGHFTSERKTVLDALRDELRKHNYSPVLFDFEKPANRDLTETVSILAHLARFIIVDLTDPSSAPHEVATVIPHTVVPVQPLLLRGPLMVDGKEVERREYAMFEDLRRRYHWVLPTFRYQDTAELLASLRAQIIAPAEQKAKELTQPK
jgi:uncharacterized protein YjbI with pentapeptide repeats